MPDKTLTSEPSDPSKIRKTVLYWQEEIRRLQLKRSEVSRLLASHNADRVRLTAELNSPGYLGSTRARYEGKEAALARTDQMINKCQNDLSQIEFMIAGTTNNLYQEQNKLTEALEQMNEKLRQQVVQKTLFDEAQQRRAIEDVRETPVGATEYDVFISHATEDKEEIVRPLADALVNLEVQVWYDEFQLTVGDSLRRSIDAGLMKSKFGIVVLSPSFFQKNWPQYELDGLVQREMEGHKVILPLWHRVTKSDVMRQSPSLADKVALNSTTSSVEELAKMFAEAVGR